MSAQQLLDLFRPPEGLVGHTGILTAFSATEGFLEAATQRFSNLSKRRRADGGYPILYLMLDAHPTEWRRDTLRPTQVPGLLELPPAPRAGDTLLHAKVGLLFFGPTRAGASTNGRLIVSTANWTETSARRQLELAWVLDVDLSGRAPAEDRADLAAAADFLQEATRSFRIASAVSTAMMVVLSRARENRPARRAKRFIHSLDRWDGARCVPLLEQIARQAPADRERPRDLVICGSGFFEEPTKKGGKPEVLARIERLPGVRPKKRYVVARGDHAGALAHWDAAADGWMIQEAHDSLPIKRSLHAKFIYVGRSWGQAAREGWLYLGSGNLTKKGLLLAPFSEKGNVEAGVVLDVPEKLSADEIRERLFCDVSAESIGDGELSEGEQELDADGVLEDAPAIVAPPILMARFAVDSDGRSTLSLEWDPDAAADHVEIALPDRWIEVSPARAAISYPGRDCPPVLLVRVGSRTWTIPVMDADGRIARTPSPPLGFKDALNELLSFPTPAPDDEDDDDDQDGLDDGIGGAEDDMEGGDLDAGGQSLGGESADDAPVRIPARRVPGEAPLEYPLLELMELLEELAQKQVSLDGAVLADWFVHLERSLRDAFPPEKVASWRKLGVPMFRTLREQGFAPQRMTDDQARAYAALLDRVAASWGYADDG